MNIVLGSSSPRRKVILENLFDKVSIVKPEIDEMVNTDESPKNFCLRMAVEKNEAISILNNDNYFLITSDTIVSYKNRILQKPRDYEDAFQTLAFLRNKTHHVISSICISKFQNRNKIICISEIEKTSVIFKDYSDEIIKKYLNLTDYTDKAGSYAIQENGNLIVDKYYGSYTNIVGFPLRLFFKMLWENKLIEIFSKEK